MIKKLLYIISFLTILTIASSLFNLHIANTGEPGDEPLPEEMPLSEPEFDDIAMPVMAHLEYRHDVRAIDQYFLKIRDYPGEGIDEIVGGFVTTNFHAHVKLKGVSVPSACDTEDSRFRPHIEVERERARWNRGLHFVQQLLMLNQSLRLSNITVEGDVLVCDVEFSLGGAWHDLTTTLNRDGYARPDAYEWNWGLEQLEPLVKEH